MLPLLQGAAYAGRLLFLVAAWRFPRLRTYLLSSFAAELVRLPLPSLLGGPPPFTGADKLLFLMDGALFTVGPVLLGWAVGLWKPLAGFWATVMVGVASAYPRVRGDALVTLYVAEHVTMHAALVGTCIVMAVKERERRGREDKALLVLALLGLTGAVLALACPDDWAVVTVANASAYALLGGLCLFCEGGDGTQKGDL
ncbi:hypothetical protein [Polyangium sp. 15x6]|uniref:hypothetical protein n=1 Tax=Polyangium sp. 15x6 TaxID=3042687 RepID=UPI00249A2CDD|nr:hypothetical protein [Polyangium sp. 15x6]MDI3282101.1 hypothetical protein [Polyangium sp. 15x6]